MMLWPGAGRANCGRAAIKSKRPVASLPTLPNQSLLVASAIAPTKDPPSPPKTRPRVEIIQAQLLSTPGPTSIPPTPHPKPHRVRLRA